MQRYVWVGIIVMMLGVGLATAWMLQSGRTRQPKLADDDQAQVVALRRQIAALQQQIADKDEALARLQRHVPTSAVAPAATSVVAPPASKPSKRLRTSPGPKRVNEASLPAFSGLCRTPGDTPLTERTGI